MLKTLLLFTSPVGRIGRGQLNLALVSLSIASLLAFYFFYFIDNIQLSKGFDLGELYGLWTNAPMPTSLITLLSVFTYSLWILVIKRLHDLDCTGWWSILFFLGINGAAVFYQSEVPVQLLQALDLANLPPLALSLSPLFLTALALLILMSKEGSPKRNHYGLPYPLLSKKHLKADLNPFHNTQAPEAPIDHLTQNTTSAPKAELSAADLRIKEMRESYKTMKQKKIEELKEKMRVSPPKKELRTDALISS